MGRREEEGACKRHGGNGAGVQRRGRRKDCVPRDSARFVGAQGPVLPPLPASQRPRHANPAPGEAGQAAALRRPRPRPLHGCVCVPVWVRAARAHAVLVPCVLK